MEKRIHLFVSRKNVLTWLMALCLVGSAAVGFNCVTADGLTAGLVAKLRRYVSIPLICKPNAGMPTIREDGIAHYDMPPEDFAQIVKDCHHMGATLLGGCCGTTPEHIRALKEALR